MDRSSDFQGETDKTFKNQRNKGKKIKSEGITQKIERIKSLCIN